MARRNATRTTRRRRQATFAAIGLLVVVALVVWIVWPSRGGKPAVEADAQAERRESVAPANGGSERGDGVPAATRPPAGEEEPPNDAAIQSDDTAPSPAEAPADLDASRVITGVRLDLRMRAFAGGQ